MADHNKLSLTGAGIYRLFKILLRNYGPQGWWPLRSRRIFACSDISDTIGFNSGGYHPGSSYSPAEDEIFEIAAGAVLTQNTNWKNAAAALDNLLSAGMLSIEKIIKTTSEVLASKIQPSGYFNQKAIKLKAVAGLLDSKNGDTPERDELLSVWGIGPETADSILLYAYGIPVFVIDAYTRRIISRFTGMSEVESAGYEDFRSAMEECLPENLCCRQEMHALLVVHAKRYCRKNPDCRCCPLRLECHKAAAANTPKEESKTKDSSEVMVSIMNNSK